MAFSRDHQILPLASNARIWRETTIKVEELHSASDSGSAVAVIVGDLLCDGPGAWAPEPLP